MEWKVTVLCMCVCFVAATDVQVGSEWKADLGWLLTCSWKLYSNDSLQSVRMYYNEQQFFIYRPETDGGTRSGIYRRPEDMMTVNCAESSDRGVQGVCSLTMEMFQPQKSNFMFSCEVSGERPMFRMERKTTLVEAFVPPSSAVVTVGSETSESGRVTLNCTSNGLPAPYLAWTVGHIRLPHDFYAKYWNATSKLWHAWSILSYTPSSDHVVVCTPEASKGTQLVTGTPVEFNSASNVKDIKSIIFAVLIQLLLLR